MVRATLLALSAYIPARPALERPHNAHPARHQTIGRSNRTTPAPAIRANSTQAWECALVKSHLKLP